MKLGAAAGLVGISCCVAPAAAALVGAASATTAIDVGNKLYGEWGWAFKGTAIAFAGAAILIQSRRAQACPVDGRPNLKKMSAWLIGTGVATYTALYYGTKALEGIA